MKYFSSLSIVAIIFAACGTVKKAQKIEEAISKKDTSQTVMVSKIDSIKQSKQILNRVYQNRIQYTTFSAKVKVEFRDKDDQDQGTANIRMRKDSIIWISLTGPLGVEGFRVLIKKDSITLWNKLNKTVQYRTIGQLSGITQIPFDFSTLQDLIVGNPVFLDSNVVSYKTKDDETLVLMVGTLFKHLITLDNSDYKVTHSKLDDLDPVRNRTMDITFSDYEFNNNIWFATKRVLSVAENNKLDINMDFKQYVINPLLTYPFNLPRNIKVK